MSKNKDLVTDFSKADSAPGCGGSRELPPELSNHIGRQLRAVYGELVEKPVPDKFTRLLEELAAKEQKEKRP